LCREAGRHHASRAQPSPSLKGALPVWRARRPPWDRRLGGQLGLGPLALAGKLGEGLSFLVTKFAPLVASPELTANMIEVLAGRVVDIEREGIEATAHDTAPGVSLAPQPQLFMR